MITKQLSHDPSKYAHDVLQAIAAKQLAKMGVDISAGQTVQYLIADAKNKHAHSRVLVAPHVNSKTRYDVKKYLEMLFSSAENILSPFGYSMQKIRDYVLHQEKQTLLNQKP